MTTKGGQEKFPGKRATVFLRSDDTATCCTFLRGYYLRTFRKPADINDGWVRYVQAIQRRLLDAGSSTMQPLSSAVSHKIELYNTSSSSASPVTVVRIIRVCVRVPRVATATT